MESNFYENVANLINETDRKPDSDQKRTQGMHPALFKSYGKIAMPTSEDAFAEIMTEFESLGLKVGDHEILMDTYRKTMPYLLESVPFVDEVEEFNETFGKPNSYEPNIPSETWQWQFIYDFILEELNEYKEACEKGDIVEVLDALLDIQYVLGNAVMLHGLKSKYLEAYQEVQASNMSKVCKTEEEAQATLAVRQEEQGQDCHVEQVGDNYIVYRTSDRKVMKSLGYFKPNLKQFFNDGER